jgi:hypothetical protein
MTQIASASTWSKRREMLRRAPFESRTEGERKRWDRKEIAEKRAAVAKARTVTKQMRL